MCIVMPGYLAPSAGLKFADIPNGLAAISKVPAAGWAQMVAYGAFCELSQDQSAGTAAAAGDFGFKVLTSSNPAEKTKKLSAEIANGRLAMMAIIGMFFQDGLTGSAWGDWALYTASPLRAFESELGVQAPVGFFDPLGFCKDGDAMVFKRRRASELKHGRLCMYATMGYIVPEYFRFPGPLSVSEKVQFADMPNGLAAMGKMPVGGGMQMIAFAGLLEYTLLKQDATRAPGDFEGVGFLGVPYAEGVVDPEKRKRSLNAELANGRLAMIAIMGMMFQDGTMGTTGPEMWFGASAFENELGVQAPVGFFDPLGLSKDGDSQVFYRRRCSEIKHGRVAMIAAMGYIIPEYFRWPGYLSPSTGLKFTDVPNGLAALSKAPAAGWAQYVAFCGFMEVFNAKQDPSNPPGMLTGNEGAFKVEFGRLGIFKGGRSKDDISKTRGLNSELANGRLAMVAIMGMMFQNGYLGTTGPEMWMS
jgi:light-harvesting complex I chlorophyll a/b binding protein 1